MWKTLNTHQGLNLRETSLCLMNQMRFGSYSYISRLLLNIVASSFDNDGDVLCCSISVAYRICFKFCTRTYSIYIIYFRRIECVNCA